MASQLHYFLLREQKADVARRVERARLAATRDRFDVAPRRGRLAAWLRRAADSQQRELPLSPRSVERAAIAARCLEVE